jgi:hypothetical protein
MNKGESREEFYPSKGHFINSKIVAVQKCAILFLNLQIRYSGEHRNRILGRSFCFFDQTFFLRYRNINQDLFFQSDRNHLFKITDERLKIGASYERIFKKINSNYI